MSYLPFPKAEAYGVEIGYEELILAIKAHSLPQESRAVGGCASERRGRQNPQNSCWVFTQVSNALQYVINGFTVSGNQKW